MEKTNIFGKNSIDNVDVNSINNDTRKSLIKRISNSVLEEPIVVAEGVKTFILEVYGSCKIIVPRDRCCIEINPSTEFRLVGCGDAELELSCSGYSVPIGWNCHNNMSFGRWSTLNTEDTLDIKIENLRVLASNKTQLTPVFGTYGSKCTGNKITLDSMSSINSMTNSEFNQQKFDMVLPQVSGSTKLNGPAIYTDISAHVELFDKIKTMGFVECYRTATLDDKKILDDYLKHTGLSSKYIPEVLNIKSDCFKLLKALNKSIDLSDEVCREYFNTLYILSEDSKLDTVIEYLSDGHKLDVRVLLSFGASIKRVKEIYISEVRRVTQDKVGLYGVDLDNQFRNLATQGLVHIFDLELYEALTERNRPSMIYEDVCSLLGFDIFGVDI